MTLGIIVAFDTVVSLVRIYPCCPADIIAGDVEHGTRLALKMQALYISETLISTYNSAQCYNPKTKAKTV
jgi:hypothetical protein